jgi:hypothetical protein
MAIGFTGQGRTAKRQGEVWRSEKSGDGAYEIFIRPDNAEPIEILTVLVSLLVIVVIHAEHPDAKIGQHYRTSATSLDLRGTIQEPFAGPALMRRLNAAAESLGPIPHARLDIGTTAVGSIKKQTARMLAADCPACGATIRLTRQVIENPGLPICPRDRVPFKQRVEGSDTELAAPCAAPASAVPMPEEGAPTRWTAAFTSAPNETVTKQLRAARGAYDRASQRWVGSTVGADLAHIRQLVTGASGFFETSGG